MLGEQLHPGLWRWSAYHEEWKRDVASFALLRGEDLVLIDPLLAPQQWPSLEEAVTGRALHVLLTIHWHARSAGGIAARFPQARVWAHSRNRAATARRTPVTDVYGLDDALPAGLMALAARPRSEVLFWEPRARALVVGDALLGDGERGEGLHTCPGSWLPQSTSLADLRRALQPALELPVEMVLTSHGASVVTDGASQLAQALAAAQ
jgi:glyoxylase-like metal-dependent hydrolase (beta-lactamase superfamily II)